MEVHLQAGLRMHSGVRRRSAAAHVRRDTLAHAFANPRANNLPDAFPNSVANPEAVAVTDAAARAATVGHAATHPAECRRLPVAGQHGKSGSQWPRQRLRLQQWRVLQWP